MKIIELRLLFLLCFFLIASVSFGQLQQSIESIKEEHCLMGLSVVTLCNGNVSGVYHAGLKDYDRNLKVDDSTMYRVASVSKLITTMGLMALWDKGSFNLDDDVSLYLGFTLRNPSWPEIPITFRMLLSHTSSIQDGNGYSNFLAATYGNSSPPHINELFLSEGSYYSSNMWRTEKPGSFFSYSNANFGLVATLIERISGERFDEFMRNSILLPLGVAGSYNVSHIQNINNLAVLYRNQNGWQAQIDNYQGQEPEPIDLTGYELGTNGFIFGPQGGLRCSAFDLAKLVEVHLSLYSQKSNPILSHEALALMHQANWTYNGSNGDNYYGLFRSWGLGTHITTGEPMGDTIFPDVDMLGHPGEAYGLISDLYFETARLSGFVFLTNGAYNGYSLGDNSAYYNVEEAVFDAVYNQSYLTCSLSEVSNSSDDLHMTLYPNPASDWLAIKGVNSSFTANGFKVYDVYGRLVMKDVLADNNEYVNISELSSGVYFISFSGKPNEVFRFVKH